VTGPLQVAYFRVAQAPQNAFAALSSPASHIVSPGASVPTYAATRIAAAPTETRV